MRVRGTLMTDNAEVMHGWALKGCGLTLKALWDIEDELKDGRLVEVLAPFAHNAINLYAVYPTRAHLPLRVRVFIDFVIATINGSLPHPHVRDGSKSSRRGR